MYCCCYCHLFLLDCFFRSVSSVLISGNYFLGFLRVSAVGFGLPISRLPIPVFPDLRPSAQSAASFFSFPIFSAPPRLRGEILPFRCPAITRSGAHPPSLPHPLFHPIPPHFHPMSPHSHPGLEFRLPHFTPFVPHISQLRASVIGFPAHLLAADRSQPQNANTRP